MGDIYIAFGSNLTADHLLENLELGIRLVGKLEELSYVSSSHLYKTRAAYGCSGDYLNAVVRYSVDRTVCTEVGLGTLLRSLQRIERAVGRTEEQAHHKDRVIDIDIVSVVVSRSASSVALARMAYAVTGGEGKHRLSLHSEGVAVHLDIPQLQLPHPRAHERRFVLQPLLDVTDQRIIRTPEGIWSTPSELLQEMANFDPADARYSPVTRLWATTKFSYLPESGCRMGILNVTPNSFSETTHLVELDPKSGRPVVDVAGATERLRQLHSQKFDVIDVGFESTRPDAPLMSAEEELQRLEAAGPFLFHKATELLVPLSIDTRRLEVFKRAVDLSREGVSDKEDPATDGGSAECRHLCGVWNNVNGLHITDDEIKWCVDHQVTYVCTHWGAFNGVTNSRSQLCDCALAQADVLAATPIPSHDGAQDTQAPQEAELSASPGPISISINGTPVTATPHSASTSVSTLAEGHATKSTSVGFNGTPVPCQHVAEQISRIKEALNDFVSRWFEQGGLRWRLVVDPGLGFGIDKRVSQAVLHVSQELFSNHILLLGFSKKSFIMDYVSNYLGYTGSVANAAEATEIAVKAFADRAILRLHDA